MKSWWIHALVLGLVVTVAGGAASADDAMQRGRGRGGGSVRQLDPRPPIDRRPVIQRFPSPINEPAYARGYDEGRQRGLQDGREGERYDPARHRPYRDAEDGYSENYGSKEAYRNNYRAGFREGYDEGYRQGTKNRR
ncbi:MAG TPA: hypothetical protein VNI78_07455 [Vicinamibacterales bacterium]|nr:hypothetical protein [Vicinamibacterales bacterium]